MRRLKIFFYKLARLWSSGEKYASKYNVAKAREMGVKVGENCRFYSTSFSSEPYLIEIGNHVTITSGVKFITHDGAIWVLRGLKEDYEKSNIMGKIVVRNNVFIGVNTIIMPGVTIEDNTVIASGSVVTRSFPSNVVIGGVPAKIIKSLDDYIELNKPNIVNTKGMSREDILEYFGKPENDKRLINK